ncbi:MAG: hypothetical protein KBS63_00770 [Clostridiales bacterium]|nr:hypothetical protein [Candidatus Crickella caballi]
MDLHCNMLMDEFKENYSSFVKMEEIVRTQMDALIREQGLYVVAFESRVKQENSLEGKLELKGGKYRTLSDITDLVGARVVTFYSSEVDKIASLVEKTFTIDWDNSVDKRKALATDQFGYMSLHYVCKVPKSIYFDPEHPEINEYSFEIQLRTALQHVWATIYHDTGYKSDIEVPREYIRKLSRLAGLLEIADEEFGTIISDINEYRRRVRRLISKGALDEILIDGDSFKSFLDSKPYDSLNTRIAAINQAEIQPANAMPFIALFDKMELKTLKDLKQMIDDYTEDAYHLAMVQLGGTDLDIVSSTIGLRNLCIIYIAKHDGGVEGLTMLFDTLGGKSARNRKRAQGLLEELKEIQII